MATVAELIQRIETRLFLLPGLDVQIHAENELQEMLRSVYNTLFDEYWDPDTTLFMSATLNGSTGEVMTDLTDIVRRFQDIHSIFWAEDEQQLPRVTFGTSRSRIRTRCVGPSGNPATVFKMYPNDEVGDVHFWYRTRLPDAAWELDKVKQTIVHMDEEILSHGVMFEFWQIENSNDQAAKLYGMKYAERRAQLRAAQWTPPLYKRSLDRDGPATRWERWH